MTGDYSEDVGGLWEWLADHGYALSVDLYADDGTDMPGTWVATALEVGGWDDDDDVTHRGEPAETPALAVEVLWRRMRGEVLT
jgi:hypothetical protein